MLIRAAALLVADHPDLRVLVVGGDEGTDTTVREGLRSLIGELGLERNVELLGFRDDVPSVVEAMDIGVCSSDFEGSPLSVMEYMEEAKPVVATAVGGIPDLIADDVNGLLVPPRDPRRDGRRCCAAPAGPRAGPPRWGARPRAPPHRVRHRCDGPATWKNLYLDLHAKTAAGV